MGRGWQVPEHDCGVAVSINCQPRSRSPKALYQDTFRTPDSFWFDPETLEFQGFHLVDGTYAALEPNAHSRLWSHQLQLFLGVHNRQLWFFSAEEELIPTPEEAAAAAEASATEERQRNDKLAAKLRELGIDPDEIA